MLGAFMCFYMEVWVCFRADLPRSCNIEPSFPAKYKQTANNITVRIAKYAVSSVQDKERCPFLIALFCYFDRAAAPLAEKH